jgi:hypothetical protein
LFIPHNFFAQPLQVAYVVDPINQTRGFFQWRDGGMTQVAGYYLIADRGDRVALARLANDLENFPNPEGGSGGSFSPRLEAELIKMLTRPGQREVSSPVEKLQIATLYGLLGMFLGVMGLAAVLWLSQLLGKIQQQNESIQALTRIVEESATRQRQLSNGLMEHAGIDDPVDFTGMLARADKERDDAKQRLESERIKVDSLAAKIKDLQSDTTRYRDALAEARTKLAEAEKDANEVAQMRVRVTDLEKDQAAQQRKIADLQPWLDTEPGKAALLMEHDLRNIRYWAYSGWACSVLLGVGLAAMYLFLKPLPSEPLSGEPLPGDPETERPTHRIE